MTDNDEIADAAAPRRAVPLFAMLVRSLRMEDGSTRPWRTWCSGMNAASAWCPRLMSWERR